MQCLDGEGFSGDVDRDGPVEKSRFAVNLDIEVGFDDIFEPDATGVANVDADDIGLPPGGCSK